MKAITVKYEDFFGEEKTETFYFHLSKKEVVELAAKNGGHMGDILEEQTKNPDVFELWGSVRMIIGAAYGERSEDGKRFVKSPEKLEEFEQHAAYDAVFDKITESEESIAEFVRGIVPGELANMVSAELAG